MSSAEFAMWVELAKVDPWDEHVDLGLGQVAATVANYAGRLRSDGVPPAVPADFLPLPRPEENVLVEPDPVQFFGRF